MIKSGGNSNTHADEDEKRAGHLLKCPQEPGYGQVCVIKLMLGGELATRRFASDDIFVDVLHWIGGMGSTIYAKIVEGTWFLIDKNVSPPKKLEVTKETTEHTLHKMGLWPSGSLLLSNKE